LKNQRQLTTIKIMLFSRTLIFKLARNKQRGAALMVMLIIIVLGSAAFLVSAFNSSTVQIERDKKTEDALAQAKAALIGRAAADSSLPGSLPCPDIIGAGNADVGPDCTSYIGRLPWKTLGLSDLRDASGAPLWYALSRNFHKDSANNIINSDTLGTLNITGNKSINNAVAIVFAPGGNLNTQNRSNATATCTTSNSTIASNLCATNYLEGSNANLNTSATPNIQYTSNNPSSTFNDQLIYITTDQLLPIVEQRIAREAKICLDNYAAANAQKYPWAADVADINLYASKPNKTRGRLPKQPVPSNDVIAMMDAITSLQSAVNSCATADNATNRNNLDSSGSTLENAAKTVKKNYPDTVPMISSSVTTPAISAANNAQVNNKCTAILANPSGNDVQQKLNATYTALDGIASNFLWNCSLIPSTYWVDWKDFIFYKIDPDFTPNGTATAIPSLQINGTGNYRAVVLVARRAISPQTHTDRTQISNYLDKNQTGTISNQTGTSFTTYKADGSGYQTINDLALCLDGKVNCK
jgi:type II secretory pathway pseudopilin PulG